MNSYIVSIRPEWVKRIIDREKTFEVRKSVPKEVPFKAYIYVTKDGINGRSSEVLLLNKHTGEVGFGDYRNACHCGKDDFEICNGHVVGEFICDKVFRTCGWRLRGDTQQCAKQTRLEERFSRFVCLTIDEAVKYAGGENREICGWHISDLKIYDKPKELSEFNRPCPVENRDCEHCITYGKPYTWDFNEKKGEIFCTRRVLRPPQSYMRVEELGE